MDEAERQAKILLLAALYARARENSDTVRTHALQREIDRLHRQETTLH